MKRRPRPGTRHRRLQKHLRTPLRAARQRRNRAARLARRELAEALVELFRGDSRLVPPAWMYFHAYYSSVINDPAAGFRVTGVS